MFGKMKILLFILLFSSGIAKADPWVSSLKTQIMDDYCHYYGRQGLGIQLIGLSLGGIAANTHFDKRLRNEWQTHWQGETTDSIANFFDSYTEVTQYKVSIPLYFIFMGIGAAFPQNTFAYEVGVLGNNTLRTLFVGAPQQAILTQALGAGRPIENSSWQPFKHHRAVSGHAFYGAIPLLNLAKQTQQPFLKASFYVLSTFPGLARINDDKHYFSQSFLGWWIAFAATRAVWQTNEVSKKPYSWLAQLMPIENGIYLGLETKF